MLTHIAAREDSPHRILLGAECDHSPSADAITLAFDRDGRQRLLILSGFTEFEGHSVATQFEQIQLNERGMLREYIALKGIQYSRPTAEEIEEKRASFEEAFAGARVRMPPTRRQ